MAVGAGYEKATKVIIKVETKEGSWQQTSGAGEQIDITTVWQSRKVYVCPRGYDGHRGHPIHCGCRGASGTVLSTFDDDQILKTAIIRRQVVVEETAP